MREFVYWIWLSLSCTPDSATFPKLIEHFKDAKAVYDADLKEISRVIGFRTSDRSLLDNKDLSAAEKIYDFCIRKGVGMTHYNADDYPKPLKNIPTPPVFLYYRGKLPDFDKEFLCSIVGTRNLSDYGRGAAFGMGYDLATAGATVVSGMAMGIDGVAMAGALSAGGKTVAVIGSGIDVCYPESHLTLARGVVKCGCVITEFAPGTKPSRYNFPKRNRIISGLSSATLVIEGKEKSGALITARHAMQQERPVYAFPGNVGNKNSELSLLLIKNGAKMFTNAEDIIKDFESCGKLNPFKLQQKPAVDMFDALNKYKVVSSCPSDDVFFTPRKRRESGIATKRVKKEINKQENAKDTEVINSNEPSVSQEPPKELDGVALKIYKRIPVSGECLIESLVDSEISLKDILRAMPKLEMHRLVELLPGEKIKRKSK
jgi:DNA processing protein